MLQNLHDIALSVKQQFMNDFSANEIVLTDEFKSTYGTILRQSNQTVDFTAHTAIVTTSGNLKMYIPNQWFVAAAYTVPFVQVFIEYKRLVDRVLDSTHFTFSEKKDFIKRLKESATADDVAKFREHAHAALQETIETVHLQSTVSLLVDFVTDYEWWFGNKTIDRGDSYVSPVLALLGVVNSSQSFIADIAYMFATNTQLASVADQMSSCPATYDNTSVQTSPLQSETVNRKTGGKNEIIYGAPGTGKSRYLEDTYTVAGYTTRVVFHPEYSYFDFIGVYKPVPLYRVTTDQFISLSGKPFDVGEPCIDYRFCPGPFIKCLVNAYLDPTHMHTLLIEEINRANAASVFGEIFQLLDRDVNGTSEYCIAPSEDLLQYLLSVQGMSSFVEDGLRIPSNLNIVATMNSADQGVQPMDAAFKRRWSFKYMRISIENAVHERARIRYASNDVTWGSLVLAINSKLISCGAEEDRLIGPYFIKPAELGQKSATDKLLLYLWDDVLRHNRDSFFSNQIKTFSNLSEKFDCDDVFDILSSNPQLISETNKSCSPTVDADEDVSAGVEQ